MTLSLPALGQGTWMMGEDPRRRREELTALRLGFDLGLTLVDTAEMYGEGRAEEIVGEALEGRREEIAVVSKVLPENASHRGTVAAAERSLRRLRIDRLDLYLLHWAGGHPLEETLTAFQALVKSGKIRAYGVSNFDVEEMDQAAALPGGGEIAVDQVLYNLARRGAERRLLPWCRRREVVLMAYSPLDQARLPLDGGRSQRAKALAEVSRRHGATPAQVTLAWLLRQPGVTAIVKSFDLRHVRENASARELRLTQADLAQLDTAFPMPTRDVPLETL